MRIAGAAASELFGLGNRHSAAVEVMRLGARRERQGDGENGGVSCCGLRPSDKACVNFIDSVATL
jgi:hypothetical protein